jgi:hypothetical protein
MVYSEILIGKFPVVTAETNLPISGKLLIYSLHLLLQYLVDKTNSSGIGGHQNHSLTFTPRRFLGAKFTNTVTFTYDLPV